LLNKVHRPNMFINELNLYIEHYKKDIEVHARNLSDKKRKYLFKFKEQLLSGIDYYKELIPKLVGQSAEYREDMVAQLEAVERWLRKEEDLVFG